MNDKNHSKPQVTILCQYFYPENVTAASLPYELSQRLINAGFNVKAVVGMPQEYHNGLVEGSEVINGIKIERIKYMSRNRKSTVGRLINNISFFVSIYINRRKLKSSDVVIAYSSPPINPIIPAFCAKKYGFKLVYVVYDIYPDMATKFGYLRENGITSTLFRMVNRYVYERCDSIIVLSEEMKKYFHDNIGFSEKITVVPNWYANNKCPKYTAKGRGLRLLYGGNVGIVQDVDTMKDGIIGLKDRKDVKFFFAAHGSRLDELFDGLDQKKVKTVDKMGYMLKSDYDTFLKTVDIAIVSLDKRMVGLASPSKFYSYLAMGKPVIFIGSKEMDVAKDVLKYNIGYVVENGDVESFKSIILDLQKDKSQLNGMSERASKLFQDKYTMKKCTGRYISVINKLLNGRRGNV